MTTPLNRVQAAWASGDPLALHREVERLAAEGHSRQALEEALESLLLAVRATGADDARKKSSTAFGTASPAGATPIATSRRRPARINRRPSLLPSATKLPPLCQLPVFYAEFKNRERVACFHGSLASRLHRQFPPRKHGTDGNAVAVGFHAFGVGFACTTILRASPENLPPSRSRALDIL